ncbi:MAG TPA: ABC transporter ATP-binding protein [Gemmatimonadales bacterium]|nr:ABC transporter ATP-binding protein [Gemmatimonadales bacterium]
MIIEAREITVRYYQHTPPALDRVSCQVAGSQLVAVVGPNGSGKTTLVRALLGLVPLERGGVLIDGRPVGDWPRRSLAQTVGVVGQQEEAVFRLTVAEAVMLGRYARLGPLAAPGAADRDAVHGALERCDIVALAERSVDSLSGGEWKRVRIARALAQEPRALVLDEPTASLDVRHEMELLELVRQLVNGGLAGLVITHHLNLAARFADRIILLDHGRLVAEGTPGEVLDETTLTRVFEWPVAITTWADGSPQVVPLRVGERATK